MTHWPFEVIDKDGSPFIKVEYLNEEKTFSPQEISSMVLMKMKEISEAKLGKEVKKAVVTLVIFPRAIAVILLKFAFHQRPGIFQRLPASCH